MRNIVFCILITAFFLGCTKSESMTKEDCDELGKIYVVKKTLNFRTGEYENRGQCK